jgi:hypothetical protein
LPELEVQELEEHDGFDDHETKNLGKQLHGHLFSGTTSDNSVEL